jgi:hypothetical protein
MKHIKLIKDEQLLDQISGGLLYVQKMTPVRAALLALETVFKLRMPSRTKVLAETK